MSSVPFQRLDIAEVFVPPCRALVLNERVAAEYGDANAFDRPFGPTRPSLFEPNSRHAGENVDAIRWHTDLHNDIWTREICIAYMQILERRAECHERLPYASRVRWRRVDPYIEVLRRPRNAVRSESVCANDEKPDVMVDECAQYIVKIGVRLVGPHRLTDP